MCGVAIKEHQHISLTLLLICRMGGQPLFPDAAPIIRCSHRKEGKAGNCASIPVSINTKIQGVTQQPRKTDSHDHAIHNSHDIVHRGGADTVYKSNGRTSKTGAKEAERSHRRITGGHCKNPCILAEKPEYLMRKQQNDCTQDQ